MTSYSEFKEFINNDYETNYTYNMLVDTDVCVPAVFVTSNLKYCVYNFRYSTVFTSTGWCLYDYVK